MKIRKEFQEELEKQLREGLGNSVHVSNEMRIRNNGKREPVLNIRRNGSSQITTCSTENLYKAYCENPDCLESVTESIMQDFKKFDKLEWVKEKIMSYQSAREQLHLKLINAKANHERLGQLPHFPYLDLAVIFYVTVETETEDIMTVEVTKDLLNAWHMDINDIYRDAFQNMKKEAIPPKPLSEVMKDLFQMEFGDGDIDLETWIKLKAMGRTMENEMYVLTNPRSLLGACRLLDVDALQGISDKLGCNLYLIPSSLHEIIILPAKDKPEVIGNMIMGINETEVEAQDRLSNALYLFEIDTRSTRIIREGAPL